MRTTFKKKTLAEWEAELADLDVCWGRVQNLEEILQDPLFREREMIVDIRQKKRGKITTLGVPVKLSETPGTVRTPPVDFGESTVSILQELGYTEDQIKAFADKGVY
jgi:crotonobetainyl-CoA:carnitine CoA-transferase CaiB-like acyl-CoA transferase